MPIVTTGGDAMGHLVEEGHLGRVVPPGDVEALETALKDLLTDRDGLAACRERLATVTPRFYWPEVAAPLVRFCHRPRRAPDLLAGGESLLATHHPVEPTRGVRRWAWLLRRSVREDGWRVTAERVWGRVRAMLSLE